MKRFVLLTLCFCMIFPLVACGNSHDHTYGEWETKKEASCTEEGQMVRKCTACDKTDTKPIAIDPAAHTIADSVCSLCGTEICNHLIYDYNADFASCYIFGIERSCKHTDIYIPDSFEDKPVTALNKSLFEGYSHITSLRLPDTVTTINARAFVRCGFESLTLPTSLTAIEDFAFNMCHKLESIVIPPSVTQIGAGAFMDCPALQSITLPPNITKIAENAFCESGIREIVIPDKVRTIDTCAFQGCGELTSITLPQNLKKIGYMAFMDCDSLKELSIPKSVTEIGENALYSIETIRYEGTKAEWEAIELGHWNHEITCTVICSDGELVYNID